MCFGKAFFLKIVEIAIFALAWFIYCATEDLPRIIILFVFVILFAVVFVLQIFLRNIRAKMNLGNSIAGLLFCLVFVGDILYVLYKYICCTDQGTARMLSGVVIVIDGIVFVVDLYFINKEWDE